MSRYTTSERMSEHHKFQSSGLELIRMNEEEEEKLLLPTSLLAQFFFVFKHFCKTADDGRGEGFSLSSLGVRGRVVCLGKAPYLFYFSSLPALVDISLFASERNFGTWELTSFTPLQKLCRFDQDCNIHLACLLLFLSRLFFILFLLYLHFSLLARCWLYADYAKNFLLALFHFFM